jgi:hypothetical protein
MQKTALHEPDSFGFEVEKPVDSLTEGKPVHEAKPKRVVALYLNPVCEHDWFKVADEHQTLEPEGKTIWKCRTCSEITNTYDWQTP